MKEFEVAALSFSRKTDLQKLAEETVKIIGSELSLDRKLEHLKKSFASLRELSKVKNKDEKWVDNHPIILYQMFNTVKLMNPEKFNEECQEFFDHFGKQISRLAKNGEPN